MSRNRPGRKFSRWVHRASEERQVADIESFSLTHKICFYKGLPGQPEGPEGGVSLPGSSRAPERSRTRCQGSLWCTSWLHSLGRAAGAGHPPSVWFPQSWVGVGVGRASTGWDPRWHCGSRCSVYNLPSSGDSHLWGWGGHTHLTRSPARSSHSPSRSLIVLGCAAACGPAPLARPVSRSLPTAVQWPPIRLGRCETPQRPLCRGAALLPGPSPPRAARRWVWGRCRLETYDQRGPFKIAYSKIHFAW